MSQHVTIENCYLHAPISTNYQQDINLLQMYSPNEANKNNDYITVKNNIFEGGYNGLSLGGTSYVKLPKEIGGQVVGNTFCNQGAKAIYAKKETNAKIIGNTIENNTTDKSDFNGLEDVYKRQGVSGLRVTYSEAIALLSDAEKSPTERHL